MGVQDLAAITIFDEITAMLFMFPLGFQEATCSIIGNCIGANNVPLARNFFKFITSL